MHDPKWWKTEHTGAWDRVKDALHRDWEQTKSDLTRGKAGTDLDQGVGDTVRQAAGTEPIPGDAKRGTEVAWEGVEDAYRFGVGARHQYGRDHVVWDNGLDARLATDWGALNAARTWAEAKPHVRRGWDAGRGKA
ncbi:MAG TPA: hypothetical protein VGM88_29035 [Kofleriaceae bacterium]|jgi:hypothetical protein